MAIPKFVIFTMFSIPIRLLLALLIGAIIGLERESDGQGSRASSVGGIRTYALAALLGALAGFFQAEGVPVLFFAITGFMVVATLVYYIIGSLMTKRLGLTSEISFLITFLLGFMAMSDIISPQLVVTVLVVTLLILSLKSTTKRFMGGVSKYEVQSFISYGLIALVILPLLPDTAVRMSDIPYLQTILSGYSVGLGEFANLEIFNPRKIWFIVALVTGIDVAGYMLGKVFGNKKSFTIASLVGGFISSTSTTQSLAQKSKRSGIVNPFVGAAILANMTSFLQVFLLVGPINSLWLVAITPTLLAIILASGLIGGIYLVKDDNKKVEGGTREDVVKDKKIFALKPAVKFACLLIAVKLVTKVCLILFGNYGFIISSVIASFAGIDAIVLNLADMAGKLISFKTALFTFILVNATNLLSKSVYTFLQSSRAFAVRFFVSVLVIIAASFVGIVLL